MPNTADLLWGNCNADPNAWLSATLTAIVKGHKQGQIYDLLTWNYPANM